jgi:hypothetical protein
MIDSTQAKREQSNSIFTPKSFSFSLLRCAPAEGLLVEQLNVADTLGF